MRRWGIASGVLVVGLVASWAVAGAVAGAPAADSGSVVSFTNDVRVDTSHPETNPRYVRDACTPSGLPVCSQRVQVNLDAVEPRDTWKPPINVFSFQTVDLGRVETFQVTDEYTYRPNGVNNNSFLFFYFVQVPPGSTTVRLRLSDLHQGQLPAGVRASVRCRRWSDTTGSLEAACPS